jgi:hypothetical protein
VAGEIADAVNDVIELSEALANELARIRTVVGKEGRLGQRAQLPISTGGAWHSCIESVNELVIDLVQPTTEVGRVIGAVASGDLSQKMTLGDRRAAAARQFLATAKVVNGMVEQLGPVRRRGDPRRPRGRHRGQARRPGEGQGGRRHLEGPDRLGQPDGR